MNSRTHNHNRRITSFAAFFFVILMLLTTAACDGFFPSERSLDHINVTPTSRFMKAGETQQYSASGVNGNGTTSDITSSASWTSSNTTVATVSAVGIVTAVAAGSSTVTAASQNVQGSAAVNVSATALTSITLAPAAPTITNGTPRQFTATGNFDSTTTTQDITSLVAWTSSDTSILVINSSGLATGVKAGTATVTASATTSTATITVNTSVTVQ